MNSDNYRKVFNVTLHFATKDEAVKLLLERNDYYDRMFPNEMGYRIGTNKATDTATFKKYVVKHTEDWDEDMIEETTEEFKDVLENIYDREFKFKLPKVIDLVRTDSLEDIRQCCAYCRNNCIIFNINCFISSYSPPFSIIAHELFHIHSQNNELKREKYYKMLGFTLCNEIEVPSSLDDKRLTNPDAMYVNVHISVNWKDKEVDVTPILLYDRTRGNSFMQCLYIVLMVVDIDNIVVPRLVNEEPITFPVEDCEGFYEKVGRNTDYIFHPEEIVATCFEKLICDEKFDTKWVKDKFKKILKE